MTHTYASYKRPTSEQKTYTDWKWKVGKNSLRKWTGKKTWGSNTCITQNRPQNTGHKKRHQRTLHNTWGKNPSRKHKYCKYICTKIGAPKYIRKILEDFKKDIDSNTIIEGDFNTPLSKINRTSKQNINKDIVALNNALDQMDLTNIYSAFHPKEAKYTFFSNAHGTFSKVDHMIGHKTSLNKFKKIEIIPSIFSDHSGLKLESNLKESPQKHSHS